MSEVLELANLEVIIPHLNFLLFEPDLFERFDSVLVDSEHGTRRQKEWLSLNKTTHEDLITTLGLIIKTPDHREVVGGNVNIISFEDVLSHVFVLLEVDLVMAWITPRVNVFILNTVR